MEPITKAETTTSRVSGDHRQFARYLGIGILATLADWAIFYALAGFLGVFYALALATSYCASTVLNFFLNRRYTFRNTYRRVHVQLAVFGAVAITGLGLNELIMYGLVQITPGSKTGISLMVTRVIATAVVFVWNFALNKRFTFRIFR
jgi:putative flippase GtrA